MAAFPSRVRAAGRQDVRAGVLLGLLCLLVYSANYRLVRTGDSTPARYLPFGIWRYGSLRLDPLRASVSENMLDPYWMVAGRDGHAISLYPVVLPVVIAPLYAPAVAYLHVRGWTDWRLQHLAIVMEKITASLIAALAAALFYLLLRRRAPPADAAILALVFAFGTNTWVTGGLALWQHGLAELLLVAALLVLTDHCTTARALCAGAILGLIAGNRPPDALLAGPLALYGLRWAGRKAGWIAVGAALPLGLVLFYNFTAAGMLMGGYGIAQRNDFFRFGLFSGIAGMLFSPARGLFVFSPFLLLVPAALFRGLRERGARGLSLAIALGTLAQLLFYAKADWRAGSSWGPRWLTDALPLLVWLLPPAFAGLRGLGRALFLIAAGVSIAIQCVGAFWYTGASEAAIHAGGVSGPEEMSGAWKIANTPFLAELRHPMARPDPALLPGLTPRVRGSLDLALADGRPVEVIQSGASVELEGWALAGQGTPAAVEAALDGRLRAATSTFFDRDDRRATPRTVEPAGWRLSFDTHGLEPGRHALALRARLRDSMLAVPFAWREITVGPAADLESLAGAPGGADALADAARVASARLKADQQPAGYWLTQHTRAARFEAPHAEMNTFLTAMMIDLLDPIAVRAGLATNVAGARTHLRDQIEADGLVRFHGRPDAPTIGTLGCRITPDADDTALAWRLAPANSALLPRVLATLAGYRTEEGLYRTWLAPRERYECIDPGRDPNPADVGIQMHLFLFLKKADPAAASALCGALPAALAQDRHWVYYAVAPLVPLLRQDELRRAGCAVPFPSARLATDVEGQDAWLAMAKALATADEEPGAGGASRLDLLRRVALDDFAWIRRAPPLLYHNDLSASVKRYYWSQDFGYALWLRLYHATERGGRADRERR